MRLAYAVFIPLLVSAQQFPDAAGLLKQRSSALKNYYSYQYTEDMSSAPMSMTTTIQAINSDRYRMVAKAAGMDAMTIVSDGHWVWIYMPMFKKYSKMPASADLVHTISSEFGAGVMQEDPELLANAKVVRSEVVMIEGQPHDCWVVETHAAKLTLPSGVVATMEDIARTYWIDKTLGLDVQSVNSGKVNGTEVRTKMIKTSLKFNERYSDGVFVFTPPADAVEVDEVIPGLKAMLSASQPAPKAEPQAIASSTGMEPKAFVPYMSPVEQTEPVAGDKNAHGMVELLLTIDTAGFVVNAEPLSGPKPLRQAATDAVRHWKFHPVLRDGKPVYAYTEATVHFMDDSKPSFKMEDMDLAGQMALGQRTAELQSKFPRSPEQVLADLEQDRGSSTGVDRSWALPDLAKAAIAAGALDKAAAYANEMLQSDREDSNRGQAVHDGNMVLGLISLKNGDLDRAKTYLLAAGKSTGSPVLGSFGPSMKLAKELLEKGERDAVLQYFSSCRTFWKMGATKLDEWSAEVRKGSVPDFGANLSY
jgi:outer membrane lipoprotein-sorting protein